MPPARTTGLASRRRDRSFLLRPVALALACAGFVLVVASVRSETLQDRAAVGVATGTAPPDRVGSTVCATCHAAESTAWKDSQHARAMQPADEASVLGDFKNAHAEHFGSQARFVREDGRFIVETEGKDGKRGQFPVDYTFGVEPLQQYLTPLADGRIQALPYAWDSRAKDVGGQRWIHLYPNEATPPGDALHWTGALQNWNYMCADCHSTFVHKGYDAAADRFQTTFSEVSVGCEACHGAGAGHVAWARGSHGSDAPNKGFSSIAAKRPAPDWTPDPITGSPAHGVSRPIGDEVETCGVCHSRRGQLAEGWQPGSRLTDFYRPSFLTPGLFEDDGQMQDEVFNYAAFQQSKMFSKGVVCSDCHDPHSAKLKAEGSAVCSQCHVPEKFATASHTGHQAVPGSPDCISCHMPARTYMVVDRRHDHSFRIPRPDLTATLGIPNTCTACHGDKPATWAASAIERWHGPARKGFQTYAAAFHAARTDDPQARNLLLRVVRDRDAPAIARATSLLSLHRSPSAETDAAVTAGLGDTDPMVRIAALGDLAGLPIEQRWRRASPLLSDPVRAVRVEAATTLAEGPPPGTGAADIQAFELAAASYVASERYNADRAESRANLGHFYARQGKAADAEREYLAAIAKSPSAAPRVDLADLYRMTGREGEAEAILRSAIALDASAAAPQHALGLSLIRQKRYDEAIVALGRAAALAPEEPRYGYVYAIALQSTGKVAESKAALEKALTASPSDGRLLGALLQHALGARQFDAALGYARRLRIVSPDDPAVAKVVEQLEQAVPGSSLR
jgi:predicted CXXCH cytochrome family protein